MTEFDDHCLACGAEIGWVALSARSGGGRIWHSYPDQTGVGRSACPARKDGRRLPGHVPASDPALVESWLTSAT